jgi:predicted naringenin-chalcone synthase
MGIGVLPGPFTIPQERTVELARLLHQAGSANQDSLGTLYRKTGIERRSTIFSDEPTDAAYFGAFFGAGNRGPGTGARMRKYMSIAPAMAAEASRRAITAAGLSCEDIRHVAAVSCTGFGAPGIDVSLIRDLGLSRGVSRLNVGFMGCHGVLNALRLGHGLSAGPPGDGLLIVSVELSSLHFRGGGDVAGAIGNALFADGAAAVVLSSASGTDNGKLWSLRSSGSYLFPDSGDLMTWTIGDHGFELSLSPRMEDMGRLFLKPRQGWAVESIKPYVQLLLDEFGPDRLMWGSDWPIALLTSDYAGTYQAMREAIGPLRTNEETRIFRTNAAGFYDIGHGGQRR